MSDLRSSLAPADYTDPARYDAEVHHVLRTGWLPVCRVDQVPDPGDRVAVTLAGLPMVAVRSDDGVIRVLGNVCPHRGSVLVDDGPGRSSTLLCPYHRWAFRLDGSFVGAPMAEGSDLEGVCLPRLRHVEWEGFVLVNPSGDAADPSTVLAGLSEHLAPWRWSELVTYASVSFDSTWNWKVMVENWIECYHHIGTHRESLEPVLPARTTAVVPAEGSPWTAMTVEGVDGLEGDPTSWVPGLPTELGRTLSVWAAFPLLLGGAVARYAFWLHVQPIDVTRHRVTWHLLVHPDRLDRITPDSIAEDLEVTTAVHREDMATCDRVQSGLASGLLDRFRLAPLEAPIADFQRFVAARTQGL